MNGDLDLSPGQEEILESWGEIISSDLSGTTFSVEEEDKRAEITQKTEAFLEDPTQERFTEMWRTGNAAGQVVAPTPIPEKWADKGQSIDELADLIREIRRSCTYDPEWEDKLSSGRPVREFFGWLHSESQPIIDMRTIRGLVFLGAADSIDGLKREDFAEQSERFSDFKSVYQEVVGHATEGTAQELPLNLEIYLLFVAVWYANESARERESNEDIAEFYTLVIEEKERRKEADENESGNETVGNEPHQPSESEALSLADIADEDADLYWVNQHNQPEIEEEYLRAKVDDVFVFS